MLDLNSSPLRLEAQLEYRRRKSPRLRSSAANASPATRTSASRLPICLRTWRSTWTSRAVGVVVPATQHSTVAASRPTGG